MYTAWLTGSSIINGCCHSLDTHTDFYIKFTTLREIKNVTHINEWRVALISLPRNHVSLQDTNKNTATVHSVFHFYLSLLLTPIKETVGHHLIEVQVNYKRSFEQSSYLWVWLTLEDLLG